MNSTSTVAPSASQPSIRVRSHANRTAALVRKVAIATTWNGRADSIPNTSSSDL